MPDEAENLEIQDPSGGEVEIQPVETAEPEPSEALEEVAATEEAAEPEETPVVKESKGVQKRIDQLVREREDWKRTAMMMAEGARPMQTVPQAPPAGPDVENMTFPDLPEPKEVDFDTYGEYIKATARWEVRVEKRREQAREQMEAQNRAEETRRQEIDKWKAEAQQKYPDFEEVVGRPDLPITPSMADFLLKSPLRTEMAYHLGKNPSEAHRLSRLEPYQQAYELGKLEGSLTTKPTPQKTQTSAPTPTSPVGGKEVPAKSLETMSYEEYKAHRARELGWRQ